MSQTAPTVPTAPVPPSISRAAVVFTAVGPAVGPFLFAVFFAVAGLWNMGPGSIFAATAYFIWFLPFFYVALAVPFLLTGIAYGVAARRLERPSLPVALGSGLVVFGACLAVLYLAEWIAGRAGFAPQELDNGDYSLWQHASNLGTLAGAMAIGVIPSWWLTRDRTAPLLWI